MRLIIALLLVITTLFQYACNNSSTYDTGKVNNAQSTQTRPFPEELGTVISNDGKVYFYLFAPSASSVSLSGSFNGWSQSGNPMTKIVTSNGAVWTTALPLSVVYNQSYKYIINRTTWVADPYSKHVEKDTGDGFNSVLKTNNVINWHPFTPPTVDKLVIYELHVESFTANDPSVLPSRRGKFLGILDKTNYLLSLGINAIEIMPIHAQESYSGYSWGYNPVLFMAIHPDYGTPDDFKIMVNELHKVGIAVIVDVVFNHAGNKNNYLWDIDNKYYFDFDGDGRVEASPGGDDSTPWGNKFALWKPVASKLVYDTLEYYIKEFNVDGFRFDGTYVMSGGNPFRNARPHLINNIINPLRAKYPNKIWIVEQLPNNTDFKGTGIAQWGEVFHDKMKAMLRRDNFEGEQYDNIDRVGRMIYYDKDSGRFTSPLEVVNYFESHDENSVYTELVTYSGLTVTDATNASKVGAIVLFTSMGIPMIMAGQEFVRPRIGQNTHKTNGDIDWSWLTTNTNIFEYYRGLIKLRKQHPALRITDPNPASKGWFKWGNEWNNENFSWGTSKHIVYALNYNGTMPGETNKFVVAVNFSTNPVTIYPFFETGTWTIVVDPNTSSGSNTVNITSNTTSWVIPPITGFIFRK
ncbi:MAG: alpha-amylase family glycosyl hydrolase [Brevinematales bacterium]|nr:alpha-amylase family glycosyl hydrolase [Brevinematales bacterium]